MVCDVPALMGCPTYTSIWWDVLEYTSTCTDAIRTIPGHVLVYSETSHQYWYIMYHPKIRAGVLCAILGGVLVYSGLSSGLRLAWKLWRLATGPTQLSTLATGPELGSTTVSLCRLSTGQIKHGLAVPKLSPCFSANYYHTNFIYGGSVL